MPILVSEHHCCTTTGIGDEASVLQAQPLMYQDLRSRLRSILRQHGVDVYVACTPANVHYASGFQSSFIDLSWQMTGTDMVIVPGDESLAPAVIVSEYCAADARAQSDIRDIRTYSLWTEGRDLAVIGNPDNPAFEIIGRPEQYRPDEIFGLIGDVIRERGLTGARIGSDFAVMKHETYLWFEKAFPGAALIDCGDALYEARRIKSAGEMKRLRQAARLFDQGVRYTTERVCEGQTVDDMRYNFEAGVAGAIRSDPAYGACQNSFFFPHLGTGGRTQAIKGDIVKLDCGVKIDGYWSDACRHFCLGQPDREQMLVHSALMAGFEAALAVFRPGTTMGEVYEAALSAVRANGLPGYSRGHFGHSIGMDDQIEEPPFIGPNDAVLEPGMVMCLEVPYYPGDVGGFNIEDMLLVTDTGHVALTTLDRGLVSL